MIGIYKISNLTNGKCYIGQSINIERRKREHLTSLARNKHDNHSMQQDYNNGHKFEFSILEETTVENLNKREIHYISLFHATEYYNTQTGGQYGYICHSENKTNSQKQIWLNNIGRKSYQSFTVMLNKHPTKSVYELYEYVYKLKHIMADYSYTNKELKNKYRELYMDIVRMRNFIWIAPHLNDKILSRLHINKTCYIYIENDELKFSTFQKQNYICKCHYKLLNRRLKALSKQLKIKYIPKIKRIYLDKGVQNIYNYSGEFFRYALRLEKQNYNKYLVYLKKQEANKHARKIKIALAMDMHTTEIISLFQISKDCLDKIVSIDNYSNQLKQKNCYIKNRNEIIKQRKQKLFKYFYINGFTYSEYKKHALYSVTDYTNKLSEKEKIQRQRALNFYKSHIYNSVKLLYVLFNWSLVKISNYFPYSKNSIQVILENKEIVMRPKEDYEFFKRKCRK